MNSVNFGPELFGSKPNLNDPNSNKSEIDCNSLTKLGYFSMKVASWLEKVKNYWERGDFIIFMATLRNLIWGLC